MCLSLDKVIAFGVSLNHWWVRFGEVSDSFGKWRWNWQGVFLAFDSWFLFETDFPSKIRRIYREMSRLQPLKNFNQGLDVTELIKSIKETTKNIKQTNYERISNIFQIYCEIFSPNLNHPWLEVPIASHLSSHAHRTYQSSDYRTP